MLRATQTRGQSCFDDRCSDHDGLFLPSEHAVAAQWPLDKASLSKEGDPGIAPPIETV